MARTIRVAAVMPMDGFSLQGACSLALWLIASEDVRQGVHDLTDRGAGACRLKQRFDQVVAGRGRTTKLVQTSPHFRPASRRPRLARSAAIWSLSTWPSTVRISIGRSSGSTNAFKPTISFRFASTSR